MPFRLLTGFVSARLLTFLDGGAWKGGIVATGNGAVHP